MENLIIANSLTADLLRYVNKIDGKIKNKTLELLKPFSFNIEMLCKELKIKEQRTYKQPLDAMYYNLYPEIDFIRMDFIFVLQESAYRYLLCVDESKLKHKAKYHYRLAIEGAKHFNDIVRKHIREIDKESIKDYEETTDTIADTIVEIIKESKL